MLKLDVFHVIQNIVIGQNLIGWKIMINKLDKASYRLRCKRCKWLDTATCFDCDMRYSEFEPAHKDAKYIMGGGKGNE